jgi:hypothetical protein
MTLFISVPPSLSLPWLPFSLSGASTLYRSYTTLLLSSVPILTSYYLLSKCFTETHLLYPHLSLAAGSSSPSLYPRSPLRSFCGVSSHPNQNSPSSSLYSVESTPSPSFSTFWSWGDEGNLTRYRLFRIVLFLLLVCFFSYASVVAVVYPLIVVYRIPLPIVDEITVQYSDSDSDGAGPLDESERQWDWKWGQDCLRLQGIQGFRQFDDDEGSADVTASGY